MAEGPTSSEDRILNSEKPSLVAVDRIDEVHFADLLRLYQGEWWSKTRMEVDVRRMLEQTDFVFGFVDRATGRLVGFSRVLTDYVYKAFVFDVIVDPSYRSFGMGKRLLDAIVAHPVLARVETLELYCRSDLVPFYKRWGFTTDSAGCNLMRRYRGDGPGT